MSKETELKEELEKKQDPIPYLIIINEKWWEGKYEMKQLTIDPAIQKISPEIKKEARRIFVYLNLEEIKNEEEWINMMTNLNNHFRKKYQKKDYGDWRPLDLNF